MNKKRLFWIIIGNLLFLFLHIWSAAVVTGGNISYSTDFTTVLHLMLTYSLLIICTKKCKISIWVVAVASVFTLYFMTLQVVWGIEGISVIMSNLNKYFDPQHQQKHYCELFSGMIGWIGEIHVIAIAIKQRFKEKVKRKSKQSV